MSTFEKIAREMSNQTPWKVKPSQINRIITDGYAMFAAHLGDVTILAWLHDDGKITVKHQAW